MRLLRGRGYPFYALTRCPFAVARLAVLVGQLAVTVLLAVEPLSFVLFAIRPDVKSEPMLLVFFVIAVVTTPILPRIETATVQLIALPLPLVNAAVGPGINTCAINHVVEPLTVILRTIRPLILAQPLLLASLKFPDVD